MFWFSPVTYAVKSISKTHWTDIVSVLTKLLMRSCRRVLTASTADANTWDVAAIYYRHHNTAYDLSAITIIAIIWPRVDCLLMELRLSSAPGLSHASEWQLSSHKWKIMIMPKMRWGGTEFKGLNAICLCSSHSLTRVFMLGYMHTQLGFDSLDLFVTIKSFQMHTVVYAYKVDLTATSWHL